MPDNFELCHRQLTGLLKRLKQNLQLLVEYDSVIRDQLNRGIIEVVTDPSPTNNDQMHYLPHHGVVQQDKTTSKLKMIVFRFTHVVFGVVRCVWGRCLMPP